MPSLEYFLPSHPFTLLQVSDQDAFAFLQGQFTNDLRHPEEYGVYGFFLNEKGKIDADAWIQAHQEHFIVYSPGTPATALLARLERVLIADEVILHPVQNEFTALILSAKPDNPPPGSLLFPSRQAPPGFWDLLLPGEIFPSYLQALMDSGATLLAAPRFHEKRLRHSRPLIPRETGSRLLPAEMGLDKAGVSFTKGCFLGQEVMARFKNFGVIRKQIGPFSWSHPTPDLPAPLFSGEGKTIGQILSSYPHPDLGFIGMGWFPRSPDAETPSEFYLDPAARQPVFPLAPDVAHS